MKLKDTSLVFDLNWHVHQNEEEERDKNSYKLFYVHIFNQYQFLAVLVDETFIFCYAFIYRYP